MIRQTLIGMAALALLGACAKEAPREPAKPESYAASFAVTPAEGQPEQRIAVPVEALLALRNPTNSDLRLFDATGRSLPLAMVWPAAQETTGQTVPAYPVLGRAVPSTDGVALTIGTDRVARVVPLVGAAGPERPVAALLDTRGVTTPASALLLDLDYPEGQLVNLTVAASADLAAWDVLRGYTVFRSGGADVVGPARIPLGDIALKDRYLRVTWGDIKGVAIRLATVQSRAGKAQPSAAVPARGARLVSAHELQLALPPGEAPAALRVRLAGGEGLIPVTFATRFGQEDPWQPSGAATLRGENFAVLPLTETRTPVSMVGTDVRIEADKRTPGFAAPPKIELLYAPVELVARFSGKPPYRLTAGLANAEGAFLQLEDIVAAGGVAKLPLAAVETGPVPVVDIAPAQAGGPFAGRKAALWLSLLAGVAILIFAVLRLLRKAPQASE
ncbi:MAG: DUF3999 family protein [Pseudomonadota bacterium]